MTTHTLDAADPGELWLRWEDDGRDDARLLGPAREALYDALPRDLWPALAAAITQLRDDREWAADYRSMIECRT